MKKNVWKELKKGNNAQELNLAIEDIGYVNKVVVYAVSHGVGIVETELIRKDLIGMGLEAKKEGILLEERLGTVEEFAENLVAEGKKENQKDRVYECIQCLGSTLIVFLVGLMLWGRLLAGSSGDFWTECHFSLSFFIGICLEMGMLVVMNYTSGWFILGKRKDIPMLIALVGSFVLVWGFCHFFLKKMAVGDRTMGGILLPNWIFLTFLPIGFVLYWYGKTRFDRMVEKVAREHQWGNS